LENAHDTDYRAEYAAFAAADDGLCRRWSGPQTTVAWSSVRATLGCGRVVADGKLTICPESGGGDERFTK